MVDPIADINSKVAGSLANVQWMNVLGWIILLIIVIAAVIYGYIIWRDKRLYNKKVTVFDIVGIHFVPAMKDQAKVVKIGKGGFEILYLKKLKMYRIAYGGRVGKDTYYFFINRDGYWYNGMLSADIKAIDAAKGLIPVTTTNASMRAQYTSLEKQIDTIHSEKASFIEKYGTFIMAIGFVIIIGVFAWLIFKEISPIFGQAAALTEKQAELTKQMADLMQRMGALPSTSSSSGLTVVK